MIDIPIGTAMLASGGLNALAGLFGNGQQQAIQSSDLHLVNPGQQALWNMLQQRAMSGAGEFGFGQAAKQAKGQVQQFLADRGVDMGSGFAAGAMGDAFSNAAAQDAAARNAFNLNLLNTPLQVAQITGRNYVPGSPSYTAFGSTKVRNPAFGSATGNPYDPYGNEGSSGVYGGGGGRRTFGNG